jgi:hypothetical protein
MSMKNSNGTPGNRTRDLLVLAQCLNQLRQVSSRANCISLDNLQNVAATDYIARKTNLWQLLGTM